MDSDTYRVNQIVQGTWVSDGSLGATSGLDSRREQTRVVTRLGAGWFIYLPRVRHVGGNAPSDATGQVRYLTRDGRGTAPTPVAPTG